MMRLLSGECAAAGSCPALAALAALLTAVLV